MLVALPLLAAIVAAVFAVQLARQWFARRRPHALAWALSLGLYAVASAMVAVGVAAGWSPTVFGTYWVAGALLNVPLLAVGQLHLLDPARAVLWWTLGGLVAVWSIAFTLGATFDAGALREASAAARIPLGKEVLGTSGAYRLIGPLNGTFLVVVIGTIWSAVRSRHWRILLIALGVTISAAGSSAVGSGRDALFSVLLALGVVVMYGGFLAAAAPARRVEEPAAEAVPA